MLFLATENLLLNFEKLLLTLTICVTEDYNFICDYYGFKLVTLIMDNRQLDVVTKLIRPTPIKQLRLTFAPKVKKVKPIAKICRISGRNYKALNIVEKEAIIIAHFGELDRTRPAINSCLAISKKFHIPYSTCQRTLRQFK